MSDAITAKIAAVTDCKGTGIDEQTAKDLYGQLGYTFPAVVTLRVAEDTRDEDGPKSIKLVLDSVEPGTDERTTEHLRELQRALYFARNPQPKLGDPDEQTVRDIVGAWKADVQGMVDDPESGLDSVMISSGGKSATITKGGE